MGRARAGTIAGRRPPGHEAENTYRRDDQELDVLSLGCELRRFRWRECAMVFQSALNAFNPVLRIRDQIYDTARAWWVTSREETNQRALELLEYVQLGLDASSTPIPTS